MVGSFLSGGAELLTHDHWVAGKCGTSAFAGRVFGGEKTGGNRNDRGATLFHLAIGARVLKVSEALDQ